MKQKLKGLLPALMVIMLIISCNKEKVVVNAENNHMDENNTHLALKAKPDSSAGQGYMILNDGNGKPCVKAPSWCFSDIAAHEPIKLSSFTASILDKTYSEWLLNPDNFNFLVELFPEYKNFLIECKEGTRSLVTLWDNEERVGILIGFKNAQERTSYTHHEASMVLYK